jgi:hypothetical protein
MTFGAMAAWQAWMLLAGAGALAAALFLIKLKPPRLLVPSLLLWRRVLDESRELTLWERIRRAVSLILTILIALALALAVARPGRSDGAAGATAGRLLVVLDSSWSMQSRTSSGETRWERATAEARRLLASASGGQAALATTADGLVEGPTSDTALLESALERLDPSGGEGAPWPRLAADVASVHFITDGATPRALDRSVVVHSVFEAAPNAAITAFEVRPSLDGQNAGDAYLEIANFAPSPQKIQLTLARGTETVFDNEFDVAAAQTLRQVVPIARGGDPAFHARIRAAANALTLDDQAVVWVDRARPLTVLVVGYDTAWLRTAFANDPEVRATFLSPDGYQPAAPGAKGREDVAIFDRWAPQEPPGRPALLFAPPVETPWLTGTSQEDLPGVPRPAPDERRPRWDTPGTHRVVDGVDPFTLSIERVRGYTSSGLVPVAISARGTALVSVDESPDHRYVVVGFGPDTSNLTGAPGFPILMGNAVEWLARPAGRDASRRPGLTTFDRGIVRLTGPAGENVPLTRVTERVLAMLRMPGLYVAEGGGSSSTFAVNAGHPRLSNLSQTAPPASGEARTVVAGASGRPWWVYLGVLAFALAFLEWWTWQRRITV